MPKAKRVGDQWSVLVYLGRDENGKKKYKRVSGPDKKIVERDASELAIMASKAPAATSKTVGQVIDEYLEIKSNILSPSTLKGYNSLRAYHYKEIADIPVEELKQSDIQQMINSEALDHSPKTVHNVYGFLTAAINEFYPNMHYRVKLPTKAKTEIQIPDSDIVKEYLSASKGTELYKAILLAAFIGLRRSEVCALLKKDVNFKANTIKIDKAIVVDDDRNAVVKRPKSYAGNRTVIMPDIVISELKKVDTERVVNLSLHQITQQFHTLNKRLGYGFRFHDLRHYNASVMLLLNVPDKYAQERIGHATNSMLKDVYQHTFDKKHTEIADMMNSYFKQVYSG